MSPRTCPRTCLVLAGRIATTSLCSPEPPRLILNLVSKEIEAVKEIKEVKEVGERKSGVKNLVNYRYLHFSMVVDGHKMLPIAGCSLGGGKHLCRMRLASSHAEMNALKFVKYDKLKDKKYCSRLKIIVVRFDHVALRAGSFVLLDSKPCYHCLKTMKNFGIDRVEYSCSGLTSLVKSSVSSLLKTRDYTVSSGHRPRRHD